MREETALPLVSVVTAVRNAEKYIGATINSVLSQTYSNFEYVIVDDCSTDKTGGIIADVARSCGKIRVYNNEKNLGSASTRNEGIKRCRGDIIFFIDGDDLWEPDKLKLQVSLMRETGAQLVYCSYDFIDSEGSSTGSPFIVPKTVDFKQMLGLNFIGCSAAGVDAQYMRGFEFPTEYYHEDYALWMLMLSAGCKAAGESKVLMHYRKLKGSRSADKLNSAKHRYKIYRKALGMSVFQSVKAFSRYAFSGIRKHGMKTRRKV